MIDLEGREGMELGREISGSQKMNTAKAIQAKNDRLLIAILGVGFLLAILVWGTAAIWGTGPVLASAPWYIPLVGSFISLIAILIGYVALGRYQVLRDPVSFWVGSGYLVYSLGQIFYALTWPGLLPNGDPIIGHLATTSAWIALVDLTFLEGFLLAAILNPWPNRHSLPGNQWLKLVFAFLIVAAIVFGLSILLEGNLPVLSGWQWRGCVSPKSLACFSPVFVRAGQHLFHPVLPALARQAGWFHYFTPNGAGFCLYDRASGRKAI